MSSLTVVMYCAGMVVGALIMRRAGGGAWVT
jgi:hypothetical protein